ncbi:MAG: CBS domain-containing protein [Bdellovibrionales bacterium]|nr:CBS domain-containing protein [Bdellovibrionales bacterium]
MPSWTNPCGYGYGEREPDGLALLVIGIWRVDVNRMPTMKTMMTPFPYSIDVMAPILRAQSLMDEHRIRHLAVRDKGELCGVISDRDINLAIGLGSEFMDQEQILVKSAYTPAPYTVDVDVSVDIVLKEMVARHIGSALVTREGKLVGIFTATDACSKFRDLLFKVYGPIPTGNDAA